MLRHRGIFRLRRVRPPAMAMPLGVARMSQVNELGFMGCRPKSGGALVAGPVAHGTPTSVTIPVNCPMATQPVVIYHTHPGGVAFPSATDVRSARAVRRKFPSMQTMCIKVPERGITACFKVPR